MPVQEYPNSWRHTCLLFNCVLLGACSFFLIAVALTRGDHDDGSQWRPLPVEHIGALGVPVHPHPHPPLPSPRGGVSADPGLCLLDQEGRLAAVAEGGSTSSSNNGGASPRAGFSSSHASQQLLSGAVAGGVEEA